MNIANRIRGLFLVSVGFFLLPTITLAGTGEETSSTATFSGLQWIWALFSLFLVAIIAFWVTKMLAGRLGYSQAKHMKVAESLFLGPNRHLYLLLFQGRVLLLSGSEQGIQLIKEIDDPVLYAELEQGSPSAPTFANGKFPEVFKSVMSVLTNNETVAAADDNNPTRQKLVESLERIRNWRAKGKGRS